MRYKIHPGIFKRCLIFLIITTICVPYFNINMLQAEAAWEYVAELSGGQSYTFDHSRYIYRISCDSYSEGTADWVSGYQTYYAGGDGGPYRYGYGLIQESVSGTQTLKPEEGSIILERLRVTNMSWETVAEIGPPYENSPDGSSYTFDHGTYIYRIYTDEFNYGTARWQSGLNTIVGGGNGSIYKNGYGLVQESVSGTQTLKDDWSTSFFIDRLRFNPEDPPASQYTLTVNVLPDGAGVTTPAAGTHQYEEGTIVNLSATANPGYQFIDWIGASGSSVTMDANKTVIARFAVSGEDPPGGGDDPEPPPIDPPPSGSGNITFSPDNTNGFNPGQNGWARSNVPVTINIPAYTPQIVDGNPLAWTYLIETRTWVPPVPAVPPVVCGEDDEGCVPSPGSPEVPGYYTPWVNAGTGTQYQTYKQNWTLNAINVSGSANTTIPLGGTVTLTAESANHSLSATNAPWVPGSFELGPAPSLPPSGEFTQYSWLVSNPPPVQTAPPNITYSGTSGGYRIDKTAPTLTLSHPGYTLNSWTNSNINISVTASDNLSGFYDSDFRATASGGCLSAPFGIVSLPTGSLSYNGSRTASFDARFNVGVTLYDVAGNAGIINGSGGGSRTFGEFRLDKTIPVGSIQWVRDGFKSQHVSIAYNDPVFNGVASGVRYMDIGRPNGSWTGWRAASTIAPDIVFSNYVTDQTVQIRFQDYAGNNSATTSDTRRIPGVTGTSLVGTGPGSPANRFLHTAPGFSWTYWHDSHNDPGNRQYGYQLNYRTPGGTAVHDTGFTVTPNTSYTYPKATTPTAPSVWWNSGDWQYRWQAKIWDAWGLESPWYQGQDFEIVALERLRVIKIGTPPPGQVSPVIDDPSTHIMIDYNTASLPRVKAGGMVVIKFDSIGPVTGIPLGSNIYYADAATGETMTATVHNFSNLRAEGSKTNTWGFEIWTRPEPDIAEEFTMITALLEGTTSVGNHAHLKAVAPFDINISRILSTAYVDWNVILKGHNE